MSKCHYIYDKQAGKVLIPCCWAVVLSNDIRDCTMQHIYIVDYQRLFILIGTTSVFTSTQNVGTNAMCCISQLCIYVLYRLLSAILRNVRYQIQRVD